MVEKTIMISSYIKTLTNYEKTCEFQHAIQDLLIEAILGLNGAPAPRLKALVKESFDQPIKEMLKIIGSSTGLRDAYTDVLLFQTPVDEAAHDADVAIADLVWIIGQYPLESADMEDFPVSKSLRARRLGLSCKRI